MGNRHSMHSMTATIYRRIVRCWLPIICILLALLAPVRFSAAQELSPISLEVEAGYNGNYRVGEWFPVTVVVSNNGPDIQGLLEWRYAANDDSGIFQRDVDLPRGARKRLTFSALNNSFSRVGTLRLLVNGHEMADEEVRIEPIEAERFVVAVVGSDETLLNSLSAMQIANTSGTTVVHLDAEMLPEHTMELTGIDAIFLHDVVTADLSDQQRAALGLWTRLGGQLVASGGINAEQTSSGLTDLLPVTVQGLQPDMPLTALSQLARNSTLPDDLTTTLSSVSLQPGARALDDSQLISAWPIGAGQAIFCAFDLAALRAWTGEPDLWEQVLLAEQSFAPAAAARWQGNNLLLNVLELPALNLPSFGLLLLFIMFYILAVGPLNFIVLRRLKRIDLAWMTIPATVALFVVATYSASFVIRGTRPQVLQATIVQGFEGQQQSQVTSFLGIFSPRRDTYQLDFPADTLVSSGRFDSLSMDEAPLAWTDTGTQVRDALVDVSSIRTFIVERTVPLEIAVESNLERSGNTITGAVTNQSGIPLNNALLVSGNTVQQLDTIAPGATLQVSLRRGQDNFPQQANAGTGGMFNRQMMMDMLFNPMGFMVGFPAPGTMETVLDSQGVYLLAWSEEPVIDVQLSNLADIQQTVVLYVVQLEL